MLLKKICLYYLLFLAWYCASVIYADGFVAGTLVSTPDGSVPIQDLIIGDKVLACTFDNDVASEVITYIVCHERDVIIRFCIDNEVVELAPDQLLFVPLQQKWLPASAIQPGMYLLGAPWRAVGVQSVTLLEHRTHTYTLALSNHHNYFIGKHRIVAHNFGGCAFAAAGAAEGITFLNAFLAANPLVAPITIAVGGAGLIGHLIWTAVGEIKESRKAKKDKNSGDSGHPQKPKRPDDDECEKKRVTQKYHNMHEVFKKTPVGKILKEVSEPTSRCYDGAKIYRITENIPELGLKEGDCYYLDKLHGDHIEVFNHKGTKLRTVLNMDGTYNVDKIIKASMRDIVECLR